MKNSLKYLHYHNQLVVIPSGSTVGLKKVEIPLPASHMEVVEYGIIPVTNGGDNNFAIGLKKGQKDIMLPVHNKRHAVTDSVAPKDRLMPINFTVQTGEAFSAMVDLSANLSSNLTFYICLTLLDRASYDAGAAAEHPNAGEDGATAVANIQTTNAPFSY